MWQVLYFYKYNLVKPLKQLYYICIIPISQIKKKGKLKEVLSLFNRESVDYNQALTPKPSILKHYMKIFNLFWF